MDSGRFINRQVQEHQPQAAPAGPALGVVGRCQPGKQHRGGEQGQTREPGRKIVFAIQVEQGNQAKNVIPATEGRQLRGSRQEGQRDDDREEETTGRSDADSNAR